MALDDFTEVQFMYTCFNFVFNCKIRNLLVRTKSINRLVYVLDNLYYYFST